MNENPQPISASPAPTAPATTANEPRSYLTILSLAFFAGPLGLARWYRGDDSGKVRFWIYVACIVLGLIPFVNILAGLGLGVLTIWGVVDFFMLHKTTTDASGMPLSATSRDMAWAKNFKTAYIISLVLSILVAIGAFILIGLIAQSALQQRAQDAIMESTQHSSSQYN